MNFISEHENFKILAVSVKYDCDDCLFSNTVIGIEGGILVGLAHGFISPALFICVGGIIYTRAHTRVIPYIRGLTTYMPLFSILFLVFALANASIPLTAG